MLRQAPASSKPTGIFKPFNLDFDQLSANEQAKAILDQAKYFLTEAKKQDANTQIKIGVTYSANHNQTEDFKNNAYRWSITLQGGMQAQVVMAVQRLLQTHADYQALQKHFYVLPISTSQRAGGEGETNQKWIEEDLAAINQHLQEGGIVIGLQNQSSVTKDKIEQGFGPFAIGGGNSHASFPTELRTQVQTTLNQFAVDYPDPNPAPTERNKGILAPVLLSPQKKEEVATPPLPAQNDMVLPEPLPDLSNQAFVKVMLLLRTALELRQVAIKQAIDKGILTKDSAQEYSNKLTAIKNAITDHGNDEDYTQIKILFTEFDTTFKQRISPVEPEVEVEAEEAPEVEPEAPEVEPEAGPEAPEVEPEAPEVEAEAPEVEAEAGSPEASKNARKLAEIGIKETQRRWDKQKSTSGLKTEEKNHIKKKLTDFGNLINYWEKACEEEHFYQNKYAGMNKLTAMRETAIALWLKLDAYKAEIEFLNGKEANTLTKEEAELLKNGKDALTQIEDYLERLKDLLSDNDKLGSKPNLYSQPKLIAQHFYVVPDNETHIHTQLKACGINIDEDPANPNEEIEQTPPSLISGEDLDTVSSFENEVRIIHQTFKLPAKEVINNNPQNLATETSLKSKTDQTINMATVQRNRDGKFISELYFSDLQPKQSRTWRLGYSLPNDVTMAWAKAVLENHIKGNPNNTRPLVLKDKTGKMDKEKIEALLIAAAYLRQMGKPVVVVNQIETPKVEPPTAKQISGFKTRVQEDKNNLFNDAAAKAVTDNLSNFFEVTTGKKFG